MDYQRPLEIILVRRHRTCIFNSKDAWNLNWRSICYMNQCLMLDQCSSPVYSSRISCLFFR